MVTGQDPELQLFNFALLSILLTFYRAFDVVPIIKKHIQTHTHFQELVKKIQPNLSFRRYIYWPTNPWLNNKKMFVEIMYQNILLILIL